MNEEEKKKMYMLVLRAAAAYLEIVADDRSDREAEDAWGEAQNVLYVLRKKEAL